MLGLVSIFLPRDLEFRGNDQSVQGNIICTPQNFHFAVPAAKRKNLFMVVHMT
jgi:hypothetical protein